MNFFKIHTLATGVFKVWSIPFPVLIIEKGDRSEFLQIIRFPFLLLLQIWNVWLLTS